MGYSVITGTVTANQGLLEAIHHAVMRGEELVLECDPSRLSAERYRIHGILKSAEILIDECEGKYQRLRSLTKVSVRNDGGKLVVVCEPKVKPSELRTRRIDETGALESISRLTGSVAQISFYPSDEFDETHFAGEVAKRGWHLHVQARMEDEESGEVKYGVSKIEMPKTREAMNALGFGRARREGTGAAGASEAEEGRND